MIRAFLLCLVLAACSTDASTVTMAPQLACAEYVKCHMYEWTIGFRHGPKLSGSHVECKCQE